MTLTRSHFPLDLFQHHLLVQLDCSDYLNPLECLLLCLNLLVGFPLVAMELVVLLLLALLVDLLPVSLELGFLLLLTLEFLQLVSLAVGLPALQLKGLGVLVLQL